MIEDLVDEPLEIVVVHDRQNTEWAVIQLIGGDIAGKVGQCTIEILGGDALFSFFFPSPRPSSGS